MSYAANQCGETAESRWVRSVWGARGMNAIAMARKEMPDLVLLDLGLPGGDGFTVLKRLQLIIQTSMIPVVVMSARDPHGNRDESLKSGAVAYLQKPLDTDILLKTIAKALGMEETEAPTQQPSVDQFPAKPKLG